MEYKKYKKIIYIHSASPLIFSITDDISTEDVMGGGVKSVLTLTPLNCWQGKGLDPKIFKLNCMKLLILLLRSSFPLNVLIG